MRWERYLKCLCVYLTMKVNCLNLNVLCTWTYSLSFHLCELACLHEFCDTDMRMDGYETQLRLAPARDIWDGLALASDLDADGIWFRQVIHGPCVAPMGSGLDIQRGLIITADAYLRTDMHHDYTTHHHCIAFCVLICRVIVIWTWLWDDVICYSWDVLNEIPWCYLSSFTGSVAGMRGELGWTHCMYLSIWAVYIVYIVNCWIFLSAGCSIGGWMVWKEYLCSVFSTCV